MSNITRRATLLLVPLAAGAALVGCQTTKSKSVSDMSESDLAFVTDAFNIIEFDRQECTIAQAQSKSPEVKALATQFLQQANDFDSKLRPIAAAAGVTPPNVLRTDLRVRAARLRLGQGKEFDRSFIEDQIVSHQDTLNMQAMVVDTPGSNAQLQELSKQGNAILTQNLEALRDLQKKMIMGRA